MNRAAFESVSQYEQTGGDLIHTWPCDSAATKEPANTATMTRDLRLEAALAMKREQEDLRQLDPMQRAAVDAAIGGANIFLTGGRQ